MKTTSLLFLLLSICTISAAQNPILHLADLGFIYAVWYFFYHRGDVIDGSYHRRSACFEKMEFREDGTIVPIVYTLDR